MGVNRLNKRDRETLACFYSRRYDALGCNVHAVGWGSVADQILRFSVLFRNAAPKGKRILDVGCGLGDVIPFLDSLTGGDYDYVGIDLADCFIKEAKKRFGKKRRQFIVGEIFDLDRKKLFDITILSGTLTHKIQNNEIYSQEVMKRMFHSARTMAALNFMSSYVDYQLPKNYHYAPEKVFKFAKSLTRWVTLHHDYPLWEFTVQLRKQPVKE